MNNVNLLAIDLAKNIFQLYGVDEQGKEVLRERLTRNKLVTFIAKLNACVIAMEACGTSNFWARKFQSFGHTVKLISPQFVKPYVKTNKNDHNDAEAICEAASRPTMRFVSPKSIAQQDIQSLHRIRNRFVQNRTALVNQIRGLLLEYGFPIAQGINKARKAIPNILQSNDEKLSQMSKMFLSDLYEELQHNDKQISKYDSLLKNIFKQNEKCKKIAQIEGVGFITATAIVANIGDAKEFKNGRHLAAFFGLVPKQFSSGNKQRMLGISKRGDSYIRTLLIHGARAAIRTSSNKEDHKSKWVMSLRKRKGMNKAAVALANKNTRIIWALLAHNEEYKKVG